jgi:hypothetical protein
MAQYRKDTEEFLGDSKTIFEVNMSADRHGNVLESGSSLEFALSISRGLHPDISFEHKTGYIGTGFSNGDTIWDDGSPYPWSSLATAQTLYLKSSTNNATDRGAAVLVTGLDSNYLPISEIVTLDGTNSTTAVATTKQYLRVITIERDNGTINEGDITATVTSGSGTVVSVMPAGFGRSHVGIYTVPAGYTAYLVKGSLSSSAAVTIGFYIRPFGKAFKLQHIAVADNTQYNYDFPLPLPFAEKTDMDVRGMVSAGKCAVNWDMILVKND